MSARVCVCAWAREECFENIFASAPFSHFPSPSLSPRAPGDPSPDRSSIPSTLARALTHARHGGRHRRRGCPLPQAPPPVLLDVGRVVAFNGYEDECRLLSYLSQDFYREDDYLVATRRVKYGGNGRTRLHALARKGDLARASRLLKVGADVNARDYYGKRPLHLASAGGHADVVTLLLDKGADVNAKDGEQKTPLHYASRGGNGAIVRLLLDKGADVNAKDDGVETPLHYASRGGHAAVVTLLLDKGADVNAMDNCAETPLFLATENGHEFVVHLLVEKGANLRAMQSGYTLLQLARDNDHMSLVRFFRKAGLDE
jgi:hypothetical protein